MSPNRYLSAQPKYWFMTMKMSLRILIIGILFVSLSTPASGTMFEFNDQMNSIIGGAGDDYVREVVQDSNGDLVLLGITDTSITSVNTKNQFIGNYDIFIAKYSKNLDFEWLQYIGGTADETSQTHIWGDVTVDSENNILVTGTTSSDDFPFQNGIDSSLNGSRDAFVQKYSPSGDLLFSTFFGGSGRDEGYSISTDSFNNIIIGGLTHSSDFPTSSIVLNEYSGGGDVYISKLSSSGGLIWTQFIGGSSEEWLLELDIDSMNNIGFVGDSYSNDITLKESLQDLLKGQNDIILGKVSPAGELLFSTYFGGFNYDVARSLIFDEKDSMIISGYTWSNNFPVEASFQSEHANPSSFSSDIEYRDAIMFKVSSNNNLEWSSYYGGSNSDIIRSIGLYTDNFIITGQTSSNDFLSESNTNGNTGGFLGLFSLNGEPESLLVLEETVSIESISIFDNKVYTVSMIESAVSTLDDTNYAGKLDTLISCFTINFIPSTTTTVNSQFLYVILYPIIQKIRNKKPE